MGEELSCPYCGMQQDDGSIEVHNIEMAPHTCSECGKTFWFNKKVEISYYTWTEGEF